MTLFWTRTWDALAGALFPTPCVCCGELIAAHDPPLCRACWDKIPLIEGECCRCGAPLPGSSGEDCGRCRRGRSVISRGAALGIYAGPLRDCVVALKYQGRHRTAERLARRMLVNPPCRNILETADVLIGVPLHPDRLRERGFNQAELLCATLARASRVSVSRGLLRTRPTRSQTDLSSRERRRNVRNAFSIPGEPALKNKVVVLVDDVVTTGATLRECASTLLEYGVREVRSITVARAE